MTTPDKRMCDLSKRYALVAAADARRYMHKSVSTSRG